jgi:DNA primase
VKDPIKLKDLILEKLDLAEVMLSYGVEFIYNPMKADEAQFRCPFHGKDNKPSARYYRSTQSCYCWVCTKKWDVISFIRDKENLGFLATIRHIIDRYKIDTSSIQEDPELKPPDEKDISDINIDIIFTKKKIKELRGKIPFEKYRALCSAYQMILYAQYCGKDIASDIKKITSKLEGFK